MKHDRFLKPEDQRDLDEAASLVENGKSLRQRVFARLRARAWRQRNRND